MRILSIDIGIKNFAYCSIESTEDKTFNIKRSVFIGNRAKYAAYALETGKVQFFVQGELGRLIQETMTSKGRIFVASRQTRGLSTEGTGGQAYTEF